MLCNGVPVMNISESFAGFFVNQTIVNQNVYNGRRRMVSAGEIFKQGLLITSNFYSILFYNSEIWHLPTIKSSLKQKILSASARALKVCSKSMTDGISFINPHKMYGRAAPDQMMNYKLVHSLFRIYNSNFNSIKFVALNFNQIFTSRLMNFITTKNSRTKVVSIV